MRCVLALIFACACTSSHDAGNGGGGASDADSGGGTGSDPGAGSGSSTIDDLHFAIVGDTRPANIDDTANYPSAIISTIYADVEAESPHPQFAIATGDYMFATTYKSEQLPQLDKYMTARSAFTGPLYPAMGNHECTGATASNCGPGAKDGTTKNMTDFVNVMLSPIGIASPYYTENLSATDGSWTAKVVVVACNAWSATQATWLGEQLAQPTTYTFVVRHEGTNAVSQTGCAASQTIIDAHPLTLLIVGHTHTYAHYASDKEVVVGNGGAPLTTGTNYGYVIVSRTASGTLTVTAYDYMSHAILNTFTIQPTGAAA